MKKIILAILAIGILGGGAFVAKAIIDKPADPQAFVNAALANYFDIESSKFASVMNLNVTEVAYFEGDLNLEVSGKIANAQDYLPNLDYQIVLNGNSSATEQEAAISASGELRILDEVFYGKLGKIELAGIPDEALALVETAKTFAGKWYSLSFKKLQEADPKIAELFEEQERQQLALRESLQNFFAGNDVLLVKSLPLSFGDEQKVKVILNPDILASDTFFAELEKMFASSRLGGIENPFEIDGKKKVEAQQMIREIVEKSNPQILLRIGKEDGILYGYEFVMDLNLADLGIAKLPAGMVKIAVSSSLAEVNQPQQIEIPENAEEIDPLQFISVPAVEEEIETEVEVETDVGVEPEALDETKAKDTSEVAEIVE
ncbi:hypothetical protein KKF38_03560 [Patescibacteria group bacterium]|nr:hypothetical protein [Patescibacteria group bacterium]